MTRKQPLTDIQKVLICNGGVGHQILRRGSSRIRQVTPPKRRFNRQDKKEKK